MIRTQLIKTLRKKITNFIIILAKIARYARFFARGLRPLGGLRPPEGGLRPPWNLKSQWLHIYRVGKY